MTAAVTCTLAARSVDHGKAQPSARASPEQQTHLLRFNLTLLQKAKPFPGVIARLKCFGLDAACAGLSWPRRAGLVGL